jgi:hypothetical protein
MQWGTVRAPKGIKKHDECEDNNEQGAKRAHGVTFSALHFWERVYVGPVRIFNLLLPCPKACNYGHHSPLGTGLPTIIARSAARCSIAVSGRESPCPLASRNGRPQLGTARPRSIRALLRSLLQGIAYAPVSLECHSRAAPRQFHRRGDPPSWPQTQPL